jgi:hypothetical protein
MVEYGACTYHENCIGDFNIHCNQGDLKVNPKDNTITIRPVKNSWSREKLLVLLRDSWNQGAYWGRQDTASSHYFDKWIEDTL